MFTAKYWYCTATKEVRLIAERCSKVHNFLRRDSSVIFAKNAQTSVLCKNAYLVLWLPLTNILKGSIVKGDSTDLAYFVHHGLSSIFKFNASRKKRRRGGHTGIHKQENPLRREEMKGEPRLLCQWVCWAQIIPSICLCWICISLLHPQSLQ